jgi:hypothetical protein
MNRQKIIVGDPRHPNRRNRLVLDFRQNWKRWMWENRGGEFEVLQREYFGWPFPIVNVFIRNKIIAQWPVWYLAGYYLSIMIADEADLIRHALQRRRCRRWKSSRRCASADSNAGIDMRSALRSSRTSIGPGSRS